MKEESKKQPESKKLSKIDGFKNDIKQNEYQLNVIQSNILVKKRELKNLLKTESELAGVVFSLNKVIEILIKEEDE